MRRLAAKIAIAIHDSRAACSQRPHKEEVLGGEACALISPAPRPSCIATSLTTALYSTTVSQGLRGGVFLDTRDPREGGGASGSQVSE
jgi:hypothetical protein